MKIKEVIHALEMFAPLPLQESYDNAGLQVGLTDAEITGALLCIDVTEAIVEEAIKKDCNLIVSHHPLIFKGCKSLTGRDYVERCVMQAIKYDIAIYTLHTNIDNAPEGVSHKMGQLLGLQNMQVLEQKENLLLKLSVYVPHDYVEKVRTALFQVGCGHIGAYDQCSFGVEGVGTFRSQEGSNPFCGTPRILHNEPETRLEVILPTYLRRVAVTALKSAHPYEEPAFDLLPLYNEWSTVGSGIIGELPIPMDEKDFLCKVKKIFKIGAVKHSPFTVGRSIKRVALCGGSGGFLLPLAAQQQADVFLTGEIKYHDYFYYQDKLLIADIGHYESEQYTTEIFESVIRKLSSDIRIVTTEINTNPINYL